MIFRFKVGDFQVQNVSFWGCKQIQSLLVTGWDLQASSAEN